MQRAIRTALAGAALACAISPAVRAQAPQPISIPLQLIYTGESSPFPAQWRLGINVGINNAIQPRTYLFDTGSSLFNAAYINSPSYWPGITPPPGGSYPASTVSDGNGVIYCYGGSDPSTCRGYQGNIVQATSLQFYTASLPGQPQTLASSLAASPGFQINALYNQMTNGQPTSIVGTTTPIEQGVFYGVFGAGAFTTNPASNPGYTAGGVLGQAMVSGVTQGYVVAANGQVNPVTTGPKNPPQQVNGQDVLLGSNPNPQAVTTCSPCVMLGLTPQLLGQFAAVNPGTTAVTATVPTGLIPWSATGPGNFANPYGGVTQNNATAEFGVRLNVALTDAADALSTTAAGLLDTGTAGNTLSTLFQNQPGISGSSSVNGGVTLAVTGMNPDGSAIPGLTTSSELLRNYNSNVAVNYTAQFDSRTPGTTNTIGLGFFLQNSVLFDLDNQAIGYTPYFVTDASLATTSSGPLVVNGNNLPLGLAGVISGAGGVTIDRGGNVQLSATNTYSGATAIAPGGKLLVSGLGSITGSSGVVNDGTFDISRAWAPVGIRTLSGSGVVNLGGQTLTVTNAMAGDTFYGVITDGGSWPGIGGSLNIAGGSQALAGVNTYTGLTTIAAGAKLYLGPTAGIASSSGLANNGVFDMSFATQPVFLQSFSGSGQMNLGSQKLTVTNASGLFSGVIAEGGDSGGTGASLALDGGMLVLTGANSYSGGTSVSGGATLGILSDSNLGAAAGGLALDNGALAAFGNVASARTVTLGPGGGLVNTNGNDVLFSTALSGPGGLAKNGAGVLTLSGANSYTGGTVVNQGILQLAPGASLSPIGALVVNAGGAFDLNGNNLTVSALSGTGGTISLGSGNLIANDAGNSTLGASITGTGGLSVTGTGVLNLTGASTYTGPTSVTGGRLAVNGSIASNVDVGPVGSLAGSGTIAGTVTNRGILAPGNSIGTLTVTGSYTQAAGSTYQVETNAAGQADLTNVNGAPGTATINGGTVQALAGPGVYAPSTTYTILNATGGVTGTYAGVTSNYPFLQASLGYDANNVYLTLKPGGFGAGGATANQSAVGRVLDQSVAGSSGDFATVIGTMATYSLAMGQAAMNALSGQNYSGFGSANLGSGLLFANMLGQQMSAARGTGASRESRTALALACDVACDAQGGGEPPSPWSLWGSAMGGTGSVAGNANSATLTYNAGGVATGVDYRFDPRFLAGVGVGFSSGNQWASGFSGQGTTNSYQASLYASFTPGAFYLDALAGYGYNDNQMTRQIVLPNLAARVAQGRTVANQFLAQLEAGYRIGLHTASAVTPFARFQGTTVSQAGFGESGAGALNLNVAAQTTGSARSVLGAEFAGAFGAEGREKLALQLRLGWAHEYADTSRPVTANFSGAPGANFTVFGAAPQRDAATVSLAANTAVAAGTSLYLRYDGEIGNGTTSHALNGGLRLTW
ncbi:MAG: autotransporter domain-containing protein [Reyranella sp.]|uniref:autotransporter outer membrane beta-barrel domain-containing protein n=1 Tax=Reyranella sp. TaxID=1929291 RepID=UPI0027319B3A|nr:autotransporter domain-containing protein [Reyranella sp.]MDP1961525.1 autotransporter domain-containing protein [Reyranella sp.]MDP2374899.1 autotransporter domain-containing protein [Reyranella sp.]